MSLGAWRGEGKGRRKILLQGSSRRPQSLPRVVESECYDPKGLKKQWYRTLFVQSIANSLRGVREASISFGPREMSSYDRASSTLAFRQLRLEEIVVRKHIHTACLFILAMVGSGAVLVNLKGVLVPFTMALMLFYSLVPIVDGLSVQRDSPKPPRMITGTPNSTKTSYF